MPCRQMLDEASVPTNQGALVGLVAIAYTLVLAALGMAWICYAHLAGCASRDYCVLCTCAPAELMKEVKVAR